MPFEGTAIARAGDLTRASMAALRSTFAQRGTAPSEEHWFALECVCRTLEGMAEGTARDAVYLSSIDCGAGKSSATIAFAHSLANSPDPRHLDVGMLICVSRKREAEGMAAELAAAGADNVVVLTEDTKQLVTQRQVNLAQTLITTQQRIDQALEKDLSAWSGRRRFADLDAFHYRGEPRQVRVHDEAFLPGVAITLKEDALHAIMGAARALSRDFRQALSDLVRAIEDAPHDALLSIPDWSTYSGVSAYSLLRRLAEEDARKGAWKGRDDSVRADLQTAIRSLFFLSGKPARVHKSNMGRTAIQFRDTVPDDMTPLLVLDASGRVRQTYRDMVKHRGMIELPRAVKDYTPLSIHWWKRGGGKASMRTGGPDIARAIVKAIGEKRDQDWLVVTHKPTKNAPDLAEMIQQELPEMTGRVHCITWGNHMATSEYAEVSNVVLCGTLFMTPAHNAALTSLCQHKAVEEGLASLEDIRLTERGETADGVFQAICRGRVRRSDGGACLPMDAYVIATPGSGMEEILRQCFPGLRSWTGPRWDTSRPRLRSPSSTSRAGSVREPNGCRSGTCRRPSRSPTRPTSGSWC